MKFEIIKTEKKARAGLLSLNGNTVETDTSVNVGGVSTATHGKYTQLTIGLSPTKAHIKRVMYYSQRISNTQLRNLTS